MLAVVNDKFSAADITVKRDEGVAIVFDDGHRAYYPLATMRLHCPCAECHSKRDAGKSVRIESTIPLTITDAELHGAWGLAVTWNDGHSTGIYSFQLLRGWSDN
ncbi:MAG: DUF971 domain-containing protein [Acidimicrobiales bacterium]